MSLNVLAKGLDNLLSTNISHDMFDTYADLCPKCNGQMLVGAYVCWGICFTCFHNEMQKDSLESST